MIRSPPYADIRILQAPFDWRRVDQQITIQRLVDDQMPFEGQNAVLLSNQGSKPIVDVAHVSGATFSFLGTQGFFAPAAKPKVGAELNHTLIATGRDLLEMC